MASDTETALSDLCDELLLSHVLNHLSVADLCAFGAASKRFAGLGGCNKLWQQLFGARWDITPLQERAAALCGSWKTLLSSKHTCELTSNGWHKPCPWEMRAALKALAEHAAASALAHAPKPLSSPGSPRSPFSASLALSPSTSRSLSTVPSLTTPPLCASSYPLTPSPSAPCLSPSPSRSNSVAFMPQSPSSLPPSPGHSGPASESGAAVGGGRGAAGEGMGLMGGRDVQLVYLLDGSGSVSEEDFTEMRRFVCTSAPELVMLLGGSHASGKVGVVQFSTEPRVELPLSVLPPVQSELDDLLAGMVRINGGTNISTAIAKAGTMLRDASAADHDAAACHTAAAMPHTPVAQYSTHGSRSAPGAPPPKMVPRVLGVGAGGGGSSMHGGGSSMHGSGSSMHGGCGGGYGGCGGGGSAPMPIPQTAPPALTLPWSPHGGMGLMAPQHVRPAGPPARVVLLLTDGRVDGYQAREARATANRLCDELPGCVLAAYGVGRGVDRGELLTIVGASPVTGALPPPPLPAPFHYHPYHNMPQPPPPHAAVVPPVPVVGAGAGGQAMAVPPPRPPPQLYQPWHLYLDLYTRDDAPW